MTRIVFFENLIFGTLDRAWLPVLGFALSNHGIFGDGKTYRHAVYGSRWI
jgi:hypothetical protein